MYRTKYGFKTATWNFTEAGHGKGAPDGVGGLVKRTADKLVAYGNDISDAGELFKSLKEADIAVNLFCITNEMISEIDCELSSVVTIPVKGTMLLHQVICREQSDGIYVRDLSCFCDTPDICDCLSLRNVVLVKHVDNESNISVQSDIPSIDIIEVSNTTDASDVSAEPSHAALDTAPTSDDLEYSVDLVGKWVVVEYDDLPYPGIVQDVDHESVVVKVMHNIGRNRFFWPTRDDVCPYDFHQVVTEFGGMESVTSRHMQVPVSVWDKVCKKLDL